MLMQYEIPRLIYVLLFTGLFHKDFSALMTSASEP